MPINEQLSFSVSFGGNVKASATATINDTSRPAYEYMLVGSNPSTTEITEIDIPTYTLASNKTSVNEGETITFTLSTTMLDTGTVVPWTVTGISAADLSSGSMTGAFVTDSAGKATTTFVLTNDSLTEGTESMVLSLNGRSEFKEVDILDTSNAPTYAVNIYDSPVNGSIVTSNAGTEVYGRITLTNGVSGHVFSVSVTGVTAIVDGQKTWTSGNLNFNMSFTSTGTATITFRNDTLNTVIGTKTISVTKISSGNGLFTVASVSDGKGYIWRGYDSINSPYTYGVELNDTLKYNNSLVESQVCSLHIAENGDLALQYWCGNVWLFNADPVLNFKLTNMTTGETYITGNVTGGKLMMNVLWWHVVPVGSQALLNRMFTAGQNIKIEFV